ncbi:MAG: type II toxin-antitoxin system VapC family toxin [Candidatus Limnocylindrales bacterium]|jgi:predicted nucleic acid-binding protein
MCAATYGKSEVSNPDRLYWDSSVYLDYLTGEHPLHGLMQMVIDDWQKGLVTLATSALTLAEVYFVRSGTPKRVDRSRDKDIDALFDPPPGHRLLIVELSRLTALRARDLARNASVSGPDAIHIASALEAHCQTMHTNDAALWTKSGTVGGTPTLRIEAPTWTKQLTVDDAISSGGSSAEPSEGSQSS